jgi:hypothetical protein
MEALLKKNNMRPYLAKIRIPSEIEKESTGSIGEKIFQLWFELNYQDEPLFKQSADRDFQQIDYADHKGYTYQVKATKAKTYTFNCDLERANEHLNSELYVFIQIDDKYAYIEPICKKEEVLTKLKRSFMEANQCFLYISDLFQQKLIL